MSIAEIKHAIKHDFKALRRVTLALFEKVKHSTDLDAERCAEIRWLAKATCFLYEAPIKKQIADFVVSVRDKPDRDTCRMLTISASYYALMHLTIDIEEH
jgi:hypothetical protein